jgi:hypothetical protein
MSADRQTCTWLLTGIATRRKGGVRCVAVVGVFKSCPLVGGLRVRLARCLLVQHSPRRWQPSTQSSLTVPAIITHTPTSAAACYSRSLSRICHTNSFIASTLITASHHADGTILQQQQQ